MKLKILSIDCSASSMGIESGSFYKARSFSDFDVVIIDPCDVSEPWSKVQPEGDGSLWTYSWSDGGFSESLNDFIGTRSEETRLLLEETGGILICFLRDGGPILNYATSMYHKDKVSFLDRYSWVPSQSRGAQLSRYFRRKKRIGKEVGDINRSHPFLQYFLAFKDKIYFEVILYEEKLIEFSNPIAVNKVGEVIALEVPFGKGKFIFLPPIEEPVDDNKLSGVLIDCVRKALEWTTPLNKPQWLETYHLPGEADILKKLKAIDEEMEKLTGKRKKVEQEINNLECLKGLLYETGKYGLEPCVRKAFRIIGFDVKEPDEYPDKPYDLFAMQDDIWVIGEVEGSANVVDREKYRQLLDYATDIVTIEGKKCKGILIGNGFINTDPSSRGEQFSLAAIRGCDNQKFCRITTCELYKAVNAILSEPENHELRSLIKQRILTCEGEFRLDP